MNVYMRPIKKEHAKEFLESIEKTKLNSDIIIEVSELIEELKKENMSL